MALLAFFILACGQGFSSIAPGAAGNTATAGYSGAAGADTAGFGGTAADTGGAAGTDSVPRGGASTGGGGGASRDTAGTAGVGGAPPDCTAAIQRFLPKSFNWMGYYYSLDSGGCVRCQRSPCGTCAVQWSQPIEIEPGRYTVSIVSGLCSDIPLYWGAACQTGDLTESVDAVPVDAGIIVSLSLDATGAVVSNIFYTGTWSVTGTHVQDPNAAAVNSSLVSSMSSVVGSPRSCE